MKAHAFGMFALIFTVTMSPLAFGAAEAGGLVQQKISLMERLDSAAKTQDRQAAAKIVADLALNLEARVRSISRSLTDEEKQAFSTEMNSLEEQIRDLYQDPLANRTVADLYQISPDYRQKKVYASYLEGAAVSLAHVESILEPDIFATIQN